MRTWIATATLAAAALAACGPSMPNVGVGRDVRPNVLLVTIDTFRADRLGAGVAPALDRLAESAIRFTAARSAVPLTLPSHTTILTGLLPPEHGVHENGVDALSDAHQTIPRLLREHGYRTAAFVGAFVLDRRFGLARGFDVYDDRILRDPSASERLEAERPASAVVDRALEWLDAAGPRPPAFFLWIHLYDPHAPYDPPAEFLERVRSVRASSPQPRASSPQPPASEESLRYDGEIAYADSQIARVFESLRARRMLDRTLVVVAGDHGEGLGDHGERTHGMLLYDSTLRVPLVIASPGRSPERRDEAVSLVDIAPTILRAAGVVPPPEMTGRDLLGGNGGALGDVHGVRRQLDLYAETEYPRVAGWSPLHALTDGRWMAIRSASATALYDLSRDPRELDDVAASQMATAAALTARVDAIRAAATQPRGRHAVSAEAAERLRALGYVAGAAPASSSGLSDPPSPVMQITAWNDFEAALSALASHRSDAAAVLKTLADGHREASIFQTTYAQALKESGRAAEALTVYRQAARRWPADATLLHDLAVAARESASHASGGSVRALRDEAAKADRAALALAPLEPTAAVAHNGLGLFATDQDRPGEAASEFEQAAALDPNNAPYWANLGNARRAMRDSAGAERAYRQALEVDARTADAANGLGVLLVESQRPAEALPWFERALAAAPDLVEARLNLGIALQQSGDTRRAADAYRDVLKATRGGAREKEAAAKLLVSLGAAR
jgi:arylsulfatase A-like enzyme/Tfp pilus assembly protein PilF